ncbi:Lrp/AsnC family transcriptional regulator [Flexivirga oryzae]|uniref:DNA-binding Lrp family transcriptional regulator n=1 Tax=Flexivirga oryzae TaxID=1794944 RepID=A0A839MZR5_9MICO|nr:DNA-binding Lrp family transcriptional regulator [Flexivirga oryzae]
MGVTPATAARRWKSLQDRRLAWIGVTVGQRRGQEITSGFVLVTCSGDPAEVAARLAQEPEVATIARTMGRHQLLLDVLVRDLEELRSYLADRLGGIPGIAMTVPLPITTIYTEGSRWQVRALDAQQVRHLGGGVPHGSRTQRTVRLDDLDRALIATMVVDARIGWAELAAHCETSAPTARRRIQRLLDDGVIELRCELATPIVGPAVQVTYLLRVPVTAIHDAGTTLAGMSTCRLAAAVVDRTNLVATMWFAGPSDAESFERSLVGAIPQVEVCERIVHIRSVKRIGHLLDAHDRATGEVVPLAAW